ncbi:MAG TPA: GNAT family N-acetyltransferase [Opitutaceae bacterium]|nr:GNAT family N-acetyltransferase [Opitutaceae bacterium]
MHTQLIVRRAGPRDLPGVTHLVAGFRDLLGRERPTRSEIARRLERLHADPAVTLGVAAAGPELLGYALQRRHLSLWAGGGAAVLEDLFVAEPARRRGIGRRLLEHAIGEARSAGSTALSLDTSESDAASTALYSGLGFSCERAGRTVGRRLRYDLRLADEPPPDTGIHWGPWMLKW